MAPTDKKMKNSKFTVKHGAWKKPQHNAHGVKKKEKWVPEQKVFEGSVKEGQGFAFQRKQKVQYEYNKLLRREKKKKPEAKALYKEEYPEHLRHLYLAEAEKLKNEAWTNRMNRSKQRMKGQEKREETVQNDLDPDPAAEAAAEAAADPADPAAAAAADPDADPAADPEPEVTGGSEQIPETTAASEKDSLPMSNRMRKKMLKKTSYQKTKEEFETVKEKRRKKKEEYQKKCQQREEAIQKYKQKKMETFQILSKKTKKGQPNLNLQMEHLLQKITQRTGK